MARWERDSSRYDRQFADRGRASRSGYGGDYRRGGYDSTYRGGWGMTHLFNTVMRGGPRGDERRGTEVYHRPGGTPYGSDFRDRPAPRRSAFGGRSARDDADRGSIGVHFRGSGRY